MKGILEYTRIGDQALFGFETHYNVILTPWEFSAHRHGVISSSYAMGYPKSVLLSRKVWDGMVFHPEGVVFHVIFESGSIKHDAWGPNYQYIDDQPYVDADVAIGIDMIETLLAAGKLTELTLIETLTPVNASTHPPIIRNLTDFEASLEQQGIIIHKVGPHDTHHS